MQDLNPYRPPNARLQDPEPPLAPPPPARTVPMANALQWFRAGFQLFARAPGKWLSIGALFFLVLIVLELLPVLGPTLRCVFGTVIEGGLLIACMRLETRGRLEVKDALAGFQRAFQPLLILGLISIVTLIAGALAATSLEGEAGLRLVLFGERSPVALDAAERTTTAPDPAATVPMTLGTLAAINVASLLAGLPLAFASALIVFHGLTPLAAVKESVHAAWRNLFALLTMGAINFILMWLALISLGLLLIPLLPWLMATAYAAYKDVYTAPALSPAPA